MIETDSEYRFRRVEAAIKQLEERGEKVRAWRVFRMAGVRPLFYDEIKEKFLILNMD